MPIINRNETFSMDLTCSQSTIMNALGGAAIYVLNRLSEFYLFHETHKEEFAGLDLAIDYGVKATIFAMFFYATYKFFKDNVKKKDV